MGCIRFCIWKQHTVFIEAVELFRILYVKAVTDDPLRRVLIFLIIQSVHTAEIRYAAFRRNTGSAKEYDVVAFIDPVF